MQKILPRKRVITRRVHRILKIRKRRNWLPRMAVKLTFLLVSLYHHISIAFLHHHHPHHISIVFFHHHHRHHFLLFPSTTTSTFLLFPSTTTTTPTTFLLFSILRPLVLFVFSPRYSIKDCQLPS